MTNNQVQYWSLRESARHNKEMEALQSFQNLETQRHNLETEQQGRTSLNLTERQLNENIRHNLVGEDQQQQSINEAVRHNQAQEQIGFGQIQATIAAASMAAGATIRSAQINADTLQRGQDINAFVSQMEIGIKQQQTDINQFNAETERMRQYTYDQDSAARQFSYIIGGTAGGFETASNIKAMTTK